MNSSTRRKLNWHKAVYYLFVVAVLILGCRAGRVYLEITDVEVNPPSAQVPIKPVTH